MGKIYTSAIDLIGKTPIMELTNIEKELGLEARLLVKLECFNPGGSVKDRVAKSMIEKAEKEGKITKNTVIIEPTSGNTGIGLSLVAAIKGYRVIIVMPDTMSVERQKVMAAYGAEIVLTDSKKGMNGAIEKATELSKEIKNSIIAGQFENPANPLAHKETTGPEIYEDTDGNVDIFVAGVGTGGTISGTGEYLKDKNPNIKIVAVEPYDSPVLLKGCAGSHNIQGIGAGFVPKTLNTDIYDEIISVKDEEAYSSARLMAKREGILVGISSGAALYVGINEAKKNENKGKTVVVLLPDTGDRYLSTVLF